MKNLISLKKLKINDFLPLSLIEVKKYLKIDNDHEDELLVTFILAAKNKFEDYADHSLLTQKWQAVYHRINSENIALPKMPVQEVNSVVLIQYNGMKRELPRHSYHYEFDRLTILKSLIYFDLEVIFTAGYGDSDMAVPSDIKEVLLKYVASLYLNRENAEDPFEQFFYYYKSFRI